MSDSDSKISEEFNHSSSDDEESKSPSLLIVEAQR
jgi:hypothetical protein